MFLCVCVSVYGLKIDGEQYRALVNFSRLAVGLKCLNGQQICELFNLKMNSQVIFWLIIINI